MMERVQVVVEEQQRHDRAGFDQRAALVDLRAGLMFQEGADQRQRQARVGVQQEVLAEGHAANAQHPGEDNRTAGQVV